MAKKKKPLHSAQIKAFNDLLKNIELRHRVVTLIIKAFGGDSPRKITSDQVAKIRIPKSEEDLLPLMNKLDFTDTDWKSDDGRYAVAKFYGEAIEPFITAMYGGSSIIQKKVLEQIAIIIRDLLTTHQLYESLISIGVPESLLFVPNVDSKDEATYREELVFNVMTALSSTKNEIDKALCFKLLEEVIEPINLGGDEKKINEVQQNMTRLLRYDGLSLLGGKMHTFDEKDDEALRNYSDKGEGGARVKSAKQNGLCPQLAWDNITIKFHNGHDVTIYYGDNSIESNYEKMGFADSKKKAPNTQWEILRFAAEHDRCIDFEKSKSITRDLKSQKKQLIQKLQTFFGIQTDPFEYIKSEVENGYFAHFMLRPEKEMPKYFLGKY